LNFRVAHNFATELKCSRNYKAFGSAKFNEVGIDGELNNSFGLAVAPCVINTRHEVPEGQWLFSGVASHRWNARNLVNGVHATETPACRFGRMALIPCSTRRISSIIMHENRLESRAGAIGCLPDKGFPRNQKISARFPASERRVDPALRAICARARTA